MHLSCSQGLPLAPNPRLHEHDLLDELKAARLDRERLDLIKKYIDSHPNLDIFDNKVSTYSDMTCWYEPTLIIQFSFHHLDGIFPQRVR